MTKRTPPNNISALREIFLDEEKASRLVDYWTSDQLLQDYDNTLGRRILWKWQAVLALIPHLEALSSPFNLIDWGCGSGVATEAWLAASQLPKPKRIHFIDRSQRARDYSLRKVAASTPAAAISAAAELTPEIATNSVLLLSHVINELSEEALANLLPLVRKAQLVLWIEPGAKTSAMLLSKAQSQLYQDFPHIFPCPKAKVCPLATAEDDGNWCHFFGRAPDSVFHSAHWSSFAREQHIDLSQLPLSFLILSKVPLSLQRKADLILGKAHMQKGYTDLVLCGDTGEIKKQRILSREQRSLQKKLKKNRELISWLDLAQTDE